MKTKFYFIIAILVISLSACGTKNTSSTGQHGDDAQAQRQDSYEQSYENPNYYYDFDDVLIPRELTPVDDEKYVFADSRFHAGFRIFEGRVVAEDLYNFFVNNMAKDNWKQTFSLKTARSVLVFEKPNKSCTITIEDGFRTTVTVFAIELITAPAAGSVSSSNIPE